MLYYITHCDVHETWKIIQNLGDKLRNLAKYNKLYLV